MYCKKCGAYLPDDALVCTACGAPVSAPAPAARPGEGATVPPAAAPGDPFAGHTAAPPPAAPEAPPPPAPQPPTGAPPQGAGPVYQQRPGPAPTGRPPVYQQGAYPPQGYQTPAYGQHAYTPPPPEEPVSTGEWVWTILVSVIPLVGLVLLLVWAFGGNTKVGKRNWARAMLIFSAVIVAFYILVLIIALVGVGTGYYF